MQCVTMHVCGQSIRRLANVLAVFDAVETVDPGSRYFRHAGRLGEVGCDAPSGRCGRGRTASQIGALPARLGLPTTGSPVGILTRHVPIRTLTFRADRWLLPFFPWYPLVTAPLAAVTRNLNSSHAKTYIPSGYDVKSIPKRKSKVDNRNT